MNSTTATPQPTAAVASLLPGLLPQRAPAKLLGKHALFWMASTVFHLAVFLIDDRAWSGAVSWRKAIVFSFSFAMMLWAFGWVLDRLPDRPKMAGRLAKTFAWASAFELALIIGQVWRGRPSHFSTEGADGIVFSLMGAAVMVISISIVVLFVWAIRRAETNATEKLAIIAGVAMIVSGLGFGQWLVQLGNEYVANNNGAVPETVISGEQGVAKFPHAVAFHGIQVFMVAAAILQRTGATARRSLNTMWALVVSYGGVLVFSILQSFGGRAPLDLNVVSGPLLAASVIVLVASFASMAVSSNRSAKEEARTTVAA